MVYEDLEDRFGTDDRHARWALIWPVLVVIGIIGIAAGVALAQDSRPGPAVATLTPTAPPSPAAEFKTWADATVRVLSERFEVPAPAWALEVKAPSLDCWKARIYTADTKTIRVYLRAPDGTPFPIEMMRYTFIHGFLHHLYAVRGVAPEPGHEKEFDRWARVLGLIR